MVYSQEYIDIITYEEFLSNFKVYETWSLAKCVGYEAHHIIPRALKQKDDRCIRCTPFEHILAHYLMAKEYGGEYTRIFVLMMSYNSYKVTELDKVTIKCLKGYSELISQGRERISELYKGQKCYNNGKKDKFFKEGESPSEWVEGRLYKHTEETKKKMSESHKGISKGSHKEETKQKISQVLKGKKRKGKWWTNGKEEMYSEVQPEGYTRGRIHRKVKNYHRSKDTEETKRKKSISAKRRCEERGQNNCIKVIDTETGIVYNSINEGLRALGFLKSGWRKSHTSPKSKYYKLQIYQENG